MRLAAKSVSGNKISLCSLAILAAIGLVFGAALLGRGFAEDLKESGTVEMEQVQIAFIGSGNVGGGTLHYEGKSYDFEVGGLGIGGIGVSKFEAKGTVYNLSELAYFPGAYVQGRYGFAAGDEGSGKLWLQNSNGVVMELETKRQGLALSLGGDAVYINLK